MRGPMLDEGIRSFIGWCRLRHLRWSRGCRVMVASVQCFGLPRHPVTERKPFITPWTEQKPTNVRLDAL